MMPDPATALREIELLLDLPCPEWSADLAHRGVELDCDGVAAGQAALRTALAAGGTHHDVLARVGRVVDAGRLSTKRRLAALAVLDVARSASHRRLAFALAQFSAAAGAENAA